MVELLLKCNGNPNHRNNSFQTPLHKAAYKGSVEVIDILLKNGADIFAVDENLTSVIQFAVRSKKIKAVQFLVDKKAIVNSLDIRLSSTLHYAASYSTVAIVRYLIELGVNPYSKDIYQLTPLHIAVEHPDEEMVETFVEYGLTSYDMSKFGQSPYDIAIHKNKYEAVELFNKLKNDKDYQSRLKRNPLTLALIMNEFDKADSLMDIVNVNEKDIFGNTPLFYAIMNKEYYLIERLLENDASIYNIDYSKDDAIYYATVVGDEKIVELIQTRKVDYTKKYAEYTVLEYAKHNRLMNVLKQLKKGMI